MKADLSTRSDCGSLRHVRTRFRFSFISFQLRHKEGRSNTVNGKFITRHLCGELIYPLFSTFLPYTVRCCFYTIFYQRKKLDGRTQLVFTWRLIHFMNHWTGLYHDQTNRASKVYRLHATGFRSGKTIRMSLVFSKQTRKSGEKRKRRSRWRCQRVTSLSARCERKKKLGGFDATKSARYVCGRWSLFSSVLFSMRNLCIWRKPMAREPSSSLFKSFSGSLYS